MNNKPIGVYDSGMGGISLWRAINRDLPDESIVYLGDGKNCPYGERSSDEICSFAFKAVGRLLAEGCKMIVVACNTATSAAIGSLRAKYPDVPFVGMEPAIKPACESTKSGIIAVLATRRSLESDNFKGKLERYAKDIEVITQVGDGFVEIVERGEEGSDEAYMQVKAILDIIQVKPVDKIVLGCTHYPFLMPHFHKAINSNNVEVIDPSPAIIRRIKHLLAEGDIAASTSSKANYKFITFASEDYRKKLIDKAYNR